MPKRLETPRRGRARPSGARSDKPKVASSATTELVRVPLSVPADSYAEFEAFSRELDAILQELGS